MLLTQHILHSMDPILSIGIAIIGSLLGISGWLKQGKKDYALLESRMILLEEKSKKIDDKSLIIIEQKVSNLEVQLKRLDTDVEKKIDHLTERVEGVFQKLNELLLVIAKTYQSNTK